MINCNKYCKKCLYKTSYVTGVACGYFLFTGKLRMFDNDNGGVCDKFLPLKEHKEERRRLKRKIQQTEPAARATDEYYRYLNEKFVKSDYKYRK